MSLFQILDCNSTLGNCCSDYSLVAILDTFRRIFDIIQLVVPIMLIVWSMFELFKLMQNPDDKKGIKPLINKFIAAAFVFFIPIIVNATLGLMPSTFSVTACWKQAKVSAEVTRSANNKYISLSKGKRSTILLDSDKYEKGKPKKKSSSGTGNGTGTGSIGNGVGSATGQSIVQYAKSFVGQRYVYGGYWNGELPYTATDCSGFVQGVFKHHGINLQRDTASQWADTSMYTLVSPNDIRAGDLIMYAGHVGILTGNGAEIVHAKGSSWGICLDPDYRSCSGKAIRGIMRIKGVN